MRTGIHPNYIKTTAVCSTCKAEYVIGSTEENIKVELCSNCHPFYTGKQTLVDSDNLVDKFNKRRKAALKPEEVKNKKEKRAQRKHSSSSKGEVTLKDMLAQIK